MDGQALKPTRLIARHYEVESNTEARLNNVTPLKANAHCGAYYLPVSFHSSARYYR